MSQSAPPPLVLAVPPPAPAKPRPGFGEAVLWCVAFLAVQVLAAIAVTSAVLSVFAFRTDTPGDFFYEQFVAFANAAAHAGRDGSPPPPAPVEFGKALAYGMLAAQVSSVGLILLLFPRRVGPDWKRQLGVRRPAPLHLLLMVLVAPAFMILADGFQEQFLRVTGMKPAGASEAVTGVFRTVPWVVTLVAVALGPGLVEELWCRGFLGRGLTARYGGVYGVLLTSFLFAALHGDVTQLAVFLVMGAYLHCVYFAARSIWVPVLLHTLNNGLAVVVMLTPALAEEGEQLKQNANGAKPAVQAAALGVFVLVSVVLWKTRGDCPTGLPPCATEVGPSGAKTSD